MRQTDIHGQSSSGGITNMLISLIVATTSIFITSDILTKMPVQSGESGSEVPPPMLEAMREMAHIVENLLVSSMVGIGAIILLGVLWGTAEWVAEYRMHYAATAFGKKYRVTTRDTVLSDEKPCYNCNKTRGDGVETERAHELVVGGISLWQYDRGFNYECNECDEADFYDYAMRKDKYDNPYQTDTDELAEELADEFDVDPEVLASETDEDESGDADPDDRDTMADIRKAMADGRKAIAEDERPNGHDRMFGSLTYSIDEDDETDESDEMPESISDVTLSDIEASDEAVDSEYATARYHGDDGRVDRMQEQMEKGTHLRLQALRQSQIEAERIDARMKAAQESVVSTVRESGD